MAERNDLHDQCQWAVDRAAAAIQAVSRAANSNRPPYLVMDDLKAAKAIVAEAAAAINAAYDLAVR